MAQKDIFQDIASNRITPKEQQNEIMPAKKPNVFFAESKEAFPYERVCFPAEVSYEERLKEFRKELARLRNHYREFLSNRLPEVDTGVQGEELSDFEFRYLDKKEIFTARNREDASWEKVRIPDYRGPAGEDGRWRAYYRTYFTCRECSGAEHVVLQFQCVDYIAKIYVNGCFVGSHEGLFAPFSFDISEFVTPGSSNELVIECVNDIPTLGVGDYLDGDKIYAATGPGWDDWKVGWHHCPAGAGITGKVTLEYRPQVYVEDIFVLPDIDNHVAQIRMGVYNYGDALLKDYALKLRILPRNFEGQPLVEYEQPIAYVGIGRNEYRMEVPLQNYRLWEPDTPWLYGAIAELSGESGVSRLTETVGIKKFVSDEESSPKGRFYLNNHPVMLRGANEMGHLQQCVMQGDYDRLIDDILIAKLCNMNYYRVTQRPVQREIYDYFDMLGMMHQCDFPLFGFLRRPQFAEAVRQCVEMEHLIRGHVSTIMVTFINEPMTLRKTDDPNSKGSRRNITKGHRNLLRDELEAFFTAARQAIYIENPTRVIKNVEGDYEPPTMEGMPDFHTYTMWYSNHAIPIGRLMAGYLPEVKEGWMIGCGEYGAEGLDNLHVMQTRYPKEWLAVDGQGNWYPDKIIRAQTHSLHGDWYPEQTTVEDWIRESQLHQAKATRLMTDAFRRRADFIQQTAVHLLIDAWPSGWMKTLVDCERVPKRAYFAYQDSLIPVRMNFYCGRKYVYGGETVPVEVWLLNDSGEEKVLRVQAAWSKSVGEGEQTAQYELTQSVPAAAARCMGILNVELPKVDKPTVITVDGCVRDVNIVSDAAVPEENANTGRIYGEKYEFIVYPSSWRLEEPELSVRMEIGDRVILPLLTEENKELLQEQIVQETAEGKTVVLVWGKDKQVEITLQKERIGLKKCQDVFFAASSPDYSDYRLDMLYNGKEDYIDMLGKYAIETNLPGECKAYTYARSDFYGSTSAKQRLPFVEEFMIGKGKLIAVSLETDGLLGFNANLDALLAGRKI